MKNKIYNVILIILIIALISVIALIAIKYIKSQQNEQEISTVIEDIKTQVEEVKNNTEKKKINAKYKGYNIVGVIKIPTIDIEYPIIEKTDEKAMQVSITKFWGNNVNDIGNFTMAGHNYIDNTMFGKTDRLKIGDIIEMTDLNGNTLKYKIFDKYIVDPNDVECVKSVRPETREVTLITCTKGRKNRLIIKAREVL